MEKLEYDDSWDFYDEDDYPAGDDHEAEYDETIEDEDEEYYYGYAPIQGNWYLDEYEDEGYEQKRGRRMRIHSVKAYSETKQRERQAVKHKRKVEAKARERQRQNYYHYNEEDDE